MSNHVFEGQGANEVYADIVRRVLRMGDTVPSRVSETRELHPAIITLNDPRQRLVTAHGRPVNVAFALAEVLWILGGRDDVEMLKHYNGQISNYSDDGVTFNAAYGHRLRHAYGHDQIEDVIEGLKRDPGSRQASLVISLPERDRAVRWQDWPGDVVPHETKDRACNVYAHVMIRDGALDWLQIVRSNDLMWGTPYNWMQFTHLQEWIAASVGVPVGKYVHVADSLHIYDYHYNEAEQIKHFDLYDYFDWSHYEMWTGRMEFVENLLEREEAIRRGGIDHPDVYQHGQYWDTVFHILEMWSRYKAGQDNIVVDMMENAAGDPVYIASMARFFYDKRWHKDGYGQQQGALEDIFDADVLDWITTRDPSASN